tara:strand:+ start:1008 stop:1604 length:597 start_codon:yes stop_codon:yes gene_type:complete
MKKVYIATSREVGCLCKDWASKNLPDGFELVDTAHESNIIISVMYSKIFKTHELVNKKAFNFHPAPLPNYRGVGLSSWLLINEETKAGVTLHEIDSGVDTGSIIEVRNFLIRDDETAQSLHHRTQKLVFKMFRDWFADILNGNYESVSQNINIGVTYKRKDLQKAKNMTKFIRAFHFDGKEPAFYYNKDKDKVYIKYE